MTAGFPPMTAGGSQEPMATEDADDSQEPMGSQEPMAPMAHGTVGTQVRWAGIDEMEDPLDTLDRIWTMAKAWHVALPDHRFANRLRNELEDLVTDIAVHILRAVPCVRFLVIRFQGLLERIKSFMTEFKRRGVLMHLMR